MFSKENWLDIMFKSKMFLPTRKSSSELFLTWKQIADQFDYWTSDMASYLQVCPFSKNTHTVNLCVILQLCWEYVSLKFKKVPRTAIYVFKFRDVLVIYWWPRFPLLWLIDGFITFPTAYAQKVNVKTTIGVQTRLDYFSIRVYNQ